MSRLEACLFCIEDLTVGAPGITPDRILDSYDYWWLVLQPEEKRMKTKIGAGLLIAKRHIVTVSDASPEEAAEMIHVIKPSSQSLCETVGTTYTSQETVGFNQGKDAGQTVGHAHVHVLPVSEEDPSELKIRGGIGGAFEALRETRLQ